MSEGGQGCGLGDAALPGAFLHGKTGYYFFEFFGVGAAAHGEVLFAAAAAVEFRCKVSYDVAGFVACRDRAWGREGYYAYFPADIGSEDY